MTREEACILARAKQTELRQERLNVLADHVADGLTITAAAKLMGIGVSTAMAYWSDIKASLVTASAEGVGG